MSGDTKGSANEPVYEVVWPLGRTGASAPIEVNPPVADLTGKTIGELSVHSSIRFDEMFARIRRKLRERFSGLEFVNYRTFGDIHGPRENEVVAALPSLLRQHGCDVVISSLAE